MQLVYAAARVVKLRVFGIAARSALQDMLLFVIPSFVGAIYFLGNSVKTSMDLFALDLALGLAIIRIGCFLGGCCYGISARWGIKYQPEYLVVVRGCRNFTCGPLPEKRVIPIQLYESAYCATVFAILWAILMTSSRLDGRVMPAFLGCYAIWRFITDFVRGISARPRRAGLSEAQWASMVAAVVAGMMIAS